jgi:PAS domain S-box-containing protein
MGQWEAMSGLAASSGSDGQAHRVQFYDDDAFLVDVVVRYVEEGLGAGDAVVVIATPGHRRAIERGLGQRPVDLAAARADGRYEALDAARTLARLLHDGRPDAALFHDVIGGTIRRRATAGRPVRAFGEMVALLWEQGDHDGAVRLEALWNLLGRELPLSLLCSYPMSGFADDADATRFQQICVAHDDVSPAESFACLDTVDAQLREVVRLQHRSHRLRRETADRAAAEDALRERTRVVEALLDVSPTPIVVLDADGAVRSWNPAATRVFGWRADEVVGQAMPGALVDDADDHAAPWRAAIAGETLSAVATRRLRRDGAVLAVCLSSAPLRDADDEIRSVVLVVEDVSLRARADAERHALYYAARRARADAEEARWRATFLAQASAVLTAVDDASTLQALAATIVPQLADVCVIDVLERDGSLRRTGASCLGADVEAATVALLGWTRVPDDGDHPLARVLAARRPLPLDEAAAGHAFPTLGVRSGVLVPLLASDGPVGVIGVASTAVDRYGDDDVALLEDVGRRTALVVNGGRLRDEARRADRLPGTLLATVSRELRTPLGVIMRSIGTLRQGRMQAADLVHTLGAMQRAGQAQARLIDDLLDVSRAASGHLRLQRHPVALSAVVDRAIEAARPDADTRIVAIVPPARATDVSLIGDAARLQQVVSNLLANALESTPAGGSVTVSIARYGARVQIVVADTGAGIDPARLPSVLDPFGHGASDSVLRLGLVAAKYIVEEHGGRITASSDGPGKGTTFVVELPLAGRTDRRVGT